MEFGTNDTLNFCIMTTSNYLTKALVMYDSLLKSCKNDFNLYYFTFDLQTFEFLNELDLEKIVPVSLTSLEEYYPELLHVKKERNQAEYFFTCTPHIIQYTLKSFDVNNVIYLDADLFFYSDPICILDEMQNHSVLITEHRRKNPSLKDLETGIFNVQFIPFKNDEIGNDVIDWWRQKCLEWCYLKYEDGKFADQGYLNFWPDLFEKIVIMKHRGAGIARWNICNYSFSKEEERIVAFDKELNKEFNLIFYHFEGLKIYSNRLLSSGLFKSRDSDKNYYTFIYRDYIKRLSKKEQELIKRLKIRRSDFRYNPFHNKFYKFILGELRRIVSPKENDAIYFFKFKSKYRWLP